MKYLVHLVLVVFWCTVAAADPAPLEAPETANEILREFNTAWDEENWENLIDAGRRLTAHPLFEQQDTEFRFFITIRYGFGQFNTENYQAALALFDTAETLSDDHAIVHYFRYITQIELESWANAFADFVDLSEENPDLFSDIRLNRVFAGLNGLRDSGDDLLHRQMLDLALTRYEPESPFSTLDFMRVRRANLLIEDGDNDAAREIIEAIIVPSALSRIRADRDFDVFWNRDWFESVTNARMSHEAYLNHLNDLIAEHPLDLSGRHSRVQILAGLGRLEEAENEARSAHDELTSGTPFSDADEYATWLLNEWAYILYALGRIDEADAIMERSMELAEGRSLNVSQTINYGALLISQARYQEGLDTLDLMEDRSASSYGDMWVWSGRVCGNHHLGNLAVRDTYLSRMSDGWDDNPAAYQRALICTNMTDEAAALMIRRLEHPSHRDGALQALQRLTPLHSIPEFENSQRWAAAVDALAEREDIQRALEPVGRIETHDILSIYWGEY